MRCVRGRRLRAARFRFASPWGLLLLLMHARWLPAAVDQIRGCRRHRDVVRHPLARSRGSGIRGAAVAASWGCGAAGMTSDELVPRAKPVEAAACRSLLRSYGCGAAAATQRSSKDQRERQRASNYRIARPLKLPALA